MPARKKLFEEESKAAELESTIRTLKKDKHSLKKHAEQLQAKVLLLLPYAPCLSITNRCPLRY
jgi:hypothetical protein